MLTSKQRAILRGKANTMDPVFIVGKGEIDETMIQGVGQAGRGHRCRLCAGDRLQVRALPAEEKGQRLRRPAEVR